jgi:uncharacterized membrane protein
MTLLILCLAIFPGIHSIAIVAPAERDRCAVAMGAAAWRCIHSVKSITGFVLLANGFLAWA